MDSYGNMSKNKPTFKEFLIEARYYQDRDLFDCPDCDAKGYQYFTTQFGEDDYNTERETCETCDGEGQLTKPEYLRITQRNKDEDADNGYISLTPR